MKVSLLVKNAYPEIYGYEHPWDIPGNEMCGKFNPLNKEKKKGEYPDFQIPFTDFEDADGMVRYYPCSAELMKYDQAEKEKERKREDMITRCMIPSERKGLVRCMHACSTCPYKKNPNDPNEEYHRTSGTVSIEFLFDNYELEFADDTTNLLETFSKKEILDKAIELIKKRSQLDQQIASLLNLSDSEIAEKLGKPRTTIRDCRNKMINNLKKYFKL